MTLLLTTSCSQQQGECAKELKRARQSLYIIRAKNPENHDFETPNNTDFEGVFARKIYLSGTPRGFYDGSGTL